MTKVNVEAVGVLIAEVAAQEIQPRFRRLAAHEQRDGSSTAGERSRQSRRALHEEAAAALRDMIMEGEAVVRVPRRRRPAKD